MQHKCLFNFETKHKKISMNCEPNFTKTEAIQNTIHLGDSLCQAKASFCPSKDFSRKAKVRRIEQNILIINNIHPIMFGRIYDSHVMELLAKIVNWYNDYLRELPKPPFKTITLLDGALERVIPRLKQFLQIDVSNVETDRRHFSLPTDSYDIDCALCMELMSSQNAPSELSSLSCGHIFHKPCISNVTSHKTWDGKCPTCRQHVIDRIYW